ncbi:MAG: tail fiber domain-containing protein [Flavobacteriaceae bacterium]|nr:tail fiber domain-containing protein [Flavobacteriaceae bacterium]
MKSSIKWGLKLSLFSALVAVSNMNAQKFHVAGHLVKCETNTKLPENTIVFIEGDVIPAGCTKITGSGDAVPVAKGAIYNQDNIQGVGLPGGLWRKSSGYNLSNLDSIKVNDLVIKSDNFNIGIGQKALRGQTTGSYNLAIGERVLQANTTGGNNIGMGVWALQKNTEGSNNVAIGKLALKDNTTGNNNVAIGRYVLESNEGGSGNVAIGPYALQKNIRGSANTAIGWLALGKNTTGSNNIAIGEKASENNTTGYNNIVIGKGASNKNGSGYENIIIGTDAGKNTGGYNNIMIGQEAGSITHQGNHNIYIGYQAGSRITYNYNTAIGYMAGENLRFRRETVSLGYQAYGYPSDASFSYGNRGRTLFLVAADGSLYSKSGTHTKLSDARTKINLGVSNKKEDLAILNKIKITNYVKKDPAERHHSVEKKIIAQELKQVYPRAVSEMKGAVSDIYLYAKDTKIKGKQVEIDVETRLAEDKKKDSLAVREHKKSVNALRTLKEGEQLRVSFWEIGTDSLLKRVTKPLKKVDNQGEKLTIELDKNSLKAIKGKKYRTLVYGRYVEDMHTVDYDAVAMLNVSATQALASKVEKLEAESNKKDILLYVLVGVSPLLGFANLRKK